MWHLYRVELYPHVSGMGWGSGIKDKLGHELEVSLRFFAKSRRGWKTERYFENKQEIQP